MVPSAGWDVPRPTAVAVIRENASCQNTIAWSALIASAFRLSAKVNTSFRQRTKVRRTRRILRPLSRIRTELAGEFSLAIRRGFIYESSKEHSYWRTSQHQLH